MMDDFSAIPKIALSDRLLAIGVAFRRLLIRRPRPSAEQSLALSAETDLTHQARRFFNTSGWRTSPSGQCSFIANKNDVYIYVLTGDHLTNAMHHPTERNFLIKVMDIRLRNPPRRPIVLALLEDQKGAEVYQEISRGKAAVLAWPNIALVNELVPDQTLTPGKKGNLSAWSIAALENEPELCVKHGQIAFRNQDVAEARRWAERAVRADPTYPGGHYLASTIYLDARELDVAEAAAKKALSLSPNTGRFVRRLSEVAYARGQVDLALPLLEKALSLDNNDPDAYHFMAHLRMRRGDLAAAEQAARTAISLNDKNNAFKNRLEQILKERQAT